MITLTVTPEENVDCGKKQVIDNAKVSKRSFEWETLLRVFNVVWDKEEYVKAGHVSLYDHRLIEGKSRLRLLHFFSVG